MNDDDDNDDDDDCDYATMTMRGMLLYPSVAPALEQRASAVAIAALVRQLLQLKRLCITAPAIAKFFFARALR